jgi:subtilisin family serine protease
LVSSGVSPDVHTPGNKAATGKNPTSANSHQSGVRLFLSTLLLSLGCLLSAPASGAPRFVPGQILIKPGVNLSETNLAVRLARQGAIRSRKFPRLNIRSITLPEEKVEAALAALRADPEIEFAERDFMAQAAFVPNDPYILSGFEWHLSRIDAGHAWDFTAGLSNTTVAVLDSGINAAHPDLAGRILPGYDFVNGDADTSDDFGHGTAVAGTLVASGNNGVGVAGVAFGCRVLPVKVVDSSGFASYSCIAQGIHYAVDQGVRVINLSLAGDAASATLQQAIDYAWSNNVVVVAAAGNNANSMPQYPAACDHVIAVSASTASDSLASFSSYGNGITLCAPGENIWTTQRDPNNPYGSWRGTSFASPIVAGVAALIASENPTLPNSEIVSILEQTADDLGLPGYDTSFGFGRVNAFRAVYAASTEPGALPPSAPQSTNEIPNDVTGDTNSPFLTINQAPGNGVRLTSPHLTITGVASDDVAIREVQVRVNGIACAVDGTTNWNSDVTLTPGSNVISVRAVDLAGNVSPDVTRTITYVAMSPLVVQVAGVGGVSPDLNGKLLEIGRIYMVKAAPGSGQAFAGWNGGAGESRTLSFVMQSNLVLTANFVSSPFPAVKGRYAGLVADTNGVSPANSGCFTLTTTSAGQFTGRLSIGGARQSFHGQLSLTGDAIVSISRRNSNPLTLTLHADLANNSDEITGTVADGAWTSELVGDRNVFSKLNPAQQAGSHAFVLQQTDETVTAANGASSISTVGAMHVKGKLQDGRPFSAGGFLARNGDYPLCLSLNHGQEIIVGWLNFPASTTPTASGTVIWVRTGTNAFSATLQAAAVP